MTLVSIALRATSVARNRVCGSLHEFDRVVAVRYRTDERTRFVACVAIPVDRPGGDQERVAGAHGVFFAVDSSDVLAVEHVLFVFDLVGVFRDLGTRREREPPDGEVRRAA